MEEAANNLTDQNRKDLLSYSLSGSLRQIQASRQLKEANRLIKIEHELLDEVLNLTEDIMLITDFKDVHFMNKRFKDLLKIKEIDEFNRSIDHNLLNIFVESKDFLHQGLLVGNETFVDLINRTSVEERTVLIDNGDRVKKAYKISFSSSNTENSYLVTLSDITHMKKKFEEMRGKAYFDGLTKVNNRNKFDELFEREFKNSKRYSIGFSLAILDIDHFKKFNDNFGHLIGDEVLMCTAQIVNNAIRETDEFSRWGGEEFALLFPNTPLENAEVVANKLREKIHHYDHPKAGSITVSFGLTHYKKGDTIESIFKRCDEALYLAKENGRNRVEVKV